MLVFWFIINVNLNDKQEIMTDVSIANVYMIKCQINT